MIEFSIYNPPECSEMFNQDISLQSEDNIFQSNLWSFAIILLELILNDTNEMH